MKITIYENVKYENMKNVKKLNKLNVIYYSFLTTIKELLLIDNNK